MVQEGRWFKFERSGVRGGVCRRITTPLRSGSGLRVDASGLKDLGLQDYLAH